MSVPNTGLESEPLNNQDRNLNDQNPSGTLGDDDSPPPWVKLLAESSARSRQQEERIRQLEEEREALRNPPPQDEPLNEGEVFSDPNKFLNKIKAEMARTVEPVNGFIAQQKREKDYRRFKSNIISGLDENALPVFKHLESSFDSYFLDEHPDIPLNESTFTEATERLVGRAAVRGQLNLGRAPAPRNPTPPRRNNTDTIPPSIRPNTGPRQSDSTPREPTMDDLDENQRKLARESGMNASEWLRMEKAPPEDAERVWREIKAERKAAKGGK